jgi:hypothetical protein
MEKVDSSGHSWGNGVIILNILFVQRGMRSLSIKYPESVLATLNLSANVFKKEAKLALAVKLFELGRLPSS